MRLPRCSRWAGVGLAATLFGGCVGAASVAPAPSVQEPAVTLTPTATAASPTPSMVIAPGGLPKGLDDRIWHTQLADGSYVVGTLGDPERVKLESTDFPFAVSATHVATFAIDVERQQSLIKFVGPGLKISEPVVVPFVVASGAFAGSEFVVTGGLADADADPGVMAIDVSTGVSRYLVEPGPAAPEWRGAVRTVLASSTGETVVISRCRQGGCRAYLILSLVPGGKSTPVDLGPVRLATEQVAVSGGDATKLSAVAMQSGKTLWTLAAEEFQGGYLADESTLVQSRLIAGIDALSFEVLRVDLLSGAVTSLYTGPAENGTVLWAELSNDRTAVLGSGSRLQEAAGIASNASISTLSVREGTLVTNAFTFPLQGEGR